MKRKIENYLMVDFPTCHVDQLTASLADRGIGPFRPYLGSSYRSVLSEKEGIALADDPKRHIVIGMLSEAPIYWTLEYEIFNRYRQLLIQYIDASPGWPTTLWIWPKPTDWVYQAAELYVNEAPGNPYSFRAIYITLYYMKRVYEQWSNFFTSQKIDPVVLKYPYVKGHVRPLFKSLGVLDRLPGWKDYPYYNNDKAVEFAERFIRQRDK